MGLGDTRVGRLVVEIVGDSSGLSTAFDDAGKKTEGFKGKIAGIGSSIAALAGPAIIGGVLAVGAGFTKATMDAMGFEKQMATVYTLMPDASAEARDKMVADVKTVAKEMGILPDAVVPALYDALGAGVPEDNVFEFIEIAHKAAIGGITDLSTTVDGLTSVVNAYGADVLDAATASDVIFQTVKVGKASFAELAGSLYNVVPTAQALGVTFGEVGAALAAMTSQGVPTRVATTQLRQMLVELSKEGTATSDMFRELSGTSFREFIAGGGTVQEALQLMEKRAQAAGVGINDLFGSVEGGSAALTLTGKGTEAFTSALAEMDNATGATDKAFETMEGTLSRQLDKIGAKFSAMSVELGGKFLPVLRDGIVPIISDYVVPAIGAVGDGLSLIFNAVGSWWSGDGQGVFSGVTDAWDEVVRVLQPGIMAMIKFVQGEVQMISDWWDENGALIVEAVGVVMGAIQAVITPVLNAIVALFEWVWPYVSHLVENNISIILDIVTLFCQILTGDWDGAWQTVQGIVETSVNSIRTVAAGGFNALATGIEFVMNGISDFIFGIWKAIVQTVADSINHMIDLINGFIEAANSVTSKVGITLPTLPKIELDFGDIEAPHLSIPKLEIPVVVTPSSDAAAGAGESSTQTASSSVAGGGVHIDTFVVQSPKADAPTMAFETTRALRTLGSRGAGA
jgi:TP901 family phage tail tape measure protein